MLTHADPQIGYIFTTLENQRDNLMVENGTLTARVKELEKELEALRPAPEVIEDLPAN